MRSRGTTFLCFICMICILLSGCRQDNGNHEEEKVAVEVAKAIEKDIAQVITMTAQLCPAENIMIFSKTPGLEATKVAVKIGDHVKKGDFLFELDKRVVRKQIEQAKLAYDIARENYTNRREQLQEAQKESEKSTNEYTQSQKIHPFMEVMLPVEKNAPQASMDTASMQLEQARANYINALEQLKDMEYYAPINGIVSQLNIEENQVVMNTQPALVISNDKNLKAKLHVSGAILGDLKIGGEVVVEIGDKKKKGIIYAINPVADIRSNLFTVEVLVENMSNPILPGSFAKINIEQNKRTNTIVIPKEALLVEKEIHYVFIEKDGVAFKKNVVPGIDGGDEVEIIEGINKGDQVIIRGQHYVKEGTPVIVVRGENDEDS